MYFKVLLVLVSISMSHCRVFVIDTPGDVGNSFFGLQASIQFSNLGRDGLHRPDLDKIALTTEEEEPTTTTQPEEPSTTTEEEQEETTPTTLRPSCNQRYDGEIDCSQGVYHPYPSDPTRFIICSNGNPYVRCCPPGTIWDQNLTTCRF